MGLQQIANAINDEFFPDPHWHPGTLLLHPTHGVIQILHGQFWGEDPRGRRGLSNYWHWKVLQTGKEMSGYGGGAEWDILRSQWTLEHQGGVNDIIHSIKLGPFWSAYVHERLEREGIVFRLCTTSSRCKKYTDLVEAKKAALNKIGRQMKSKEPELAKAIKEIN